MKATELRIGNWVNDFAMESHQVIHLTKDKIILETPIPLTEEWLLKFGFKHDGYDYWNARDEYFELAQYPTYFMHSINCHEYDDGVEIKYVHQLQNLYFALTGKELI